MSEWDKVIRRVEAVLARVEGVLPAPAAPTGAREGAPRADSKAATSETQPKKVSILRNAQVARWCGP